MEEEERPENEGLGTVWELSPSKGDCKATCQRPQGRPGDHGWLGRTRTNPRPPREGIHAHMWVEGELTSCSGLCSYTLPLLRPNIVFLRFYFKSFLQGTASPTWGNANMEGSMKVGASLLCPLSICSNAHPGPHRLWHDPLLSLPSVTSVSRCLCVPQFPHLYSGGLWAV